MLKINQILKNKFDYFLKILLLILIILFNRTTLVYGANNNWIEVSKTPTGIQYLDKDSLIIDIKTIHIEIF